MATANRASEMAVFVRVAAAGSFTAAARELALSPSAVSKLIARLEERLDARLIQRTTRRLSLTEEGQAFFERASRILDDIDEAEQAVARLHAAPSGLLKITAAAAFANSQVAPLLPEFVRRYPLVHLQFTVSDRVVDLIEERFDLGIRIGARFESSLVSRLLVEDRRMICAAPDYLTRHGTPIAPADLARHNCLAWTSSQGQLNAWPFTGADGAYTVTARGNTEVNSGDVLYEMCRAGLGIARLAEFRVGADIQTGRLVSLLADHHRVDPLPVHVVYPHRQHLSPKVRAFVDFLVKCFTPIPPWRADGRADR